MSACLQFVSRLANIELVLADFVPRFLCVQEEAINKLEEHHTEANPKLQKFSNKVVEKAQVLSSFLCCRKDLTHIIELMSF
jgi:hypothetical protein